MKKILHISKYYYPFRGGTEQVARDCVLALGKDCWQIVFCQVIGTVCGQHIFLNTCVAVCQYCDFVHTIFLLLVRLVTVRRKYYKQTYMKSKFIIPMFFGIYAVIVDNRLNIGISVI